MPILWDKYVILSLTFLQYTFHDKFLQLKKRERERIGAQTFQGPKIHITKFSMVIYKIKNKKNLKGRSGQSGIVYNMDVLRRHG
jgi:hypothetical protein